MQCKCGGETVDRVVIRKGEKAGEYAICNGCKRICWIWKSDDLSEEIETTLKTGVSMDE